MTIQHPKLVTEDQAKTVLQLFSQLDDKAGQDLFDVSACLGVNESELQSILLTDPESVTLLMKLIDELVRAGMESGLFQPTQPTVSNDPEGKNS